MPAEIPTTAAASVGVSPAPAAVAQALAAVHAAARLEIDIRWLLDRQEGLLGKELAVRDYSALVAAVARHRVNTPQIEVGSPDAYWQAAAVLEQIVLLRAPAGPQRVVVTAPRPGIGKAEASPGGPDRTDPGSAGAGPGLGTSSPSP
ncbi:hypothetical protein ACFZDP_20775 [Streptomyces mirabilis]|uniref:hypothetical protein n=1 Tax=Streptomyces mirabilis TaxID=68239 RepID=UPI0006CD63F4|nr:hypothetical protein OK006_1205 [Actinobacteria bacterium OK006]